MPTDPVSQRLLHHYANHLSHHVTDPSMQFAIFSNFHDATYRHFSHAYVRHALLTYSALHLASVDSSNGNQVPEITDYAKAHLLTALSHKAEAVSHLRLVVGSLSPLTCESALAASGLLVSCAFALPMITHQQRKQTSTASEDEHDDLVEHLAQIVSLFRGSMAIFRLGWGRETPRPLDERSSVEMKQKIVAAWANEASWPEADAAVARALAAISQLDGETSLGDGPRLAASSSTADVVDGQEDNGATAPGSGFSSPATRREALADAALKLRTTMRRVAAGRGAYHIAMVWLGMVSPAYVELLRARDPLALVLLADWVVCLRQTPRVWWHKGWAEWTVGAIGQELEDRPGCEGYLGLIDWARREVVWGVGHE